MTRRFPSVPTTDARLMTLMYGTVRRGVLYNSELLLPFCDNINSISCKQSHIFLYTQRWHR